MQSEAKCRGGSAKIGWSDKKLRYNAKMNGAVAPRLGTWQALEHAVRGKM